MEGESWGRLWAAAHPCKVGLPSSREVIRAVVVDAFGGRLWPSRKVALGVAVNAFRGSFVAESRRCFWR